MGDYPVYKCSSNLCFFGFRVSPSISISPANYTRDAASRKLRMTFNEEAADKGPKADKKARNLDSSSESDGARISAKEDRAYLKTVYEYVS